MCQDPKGLDTPNTAASFLSCFCLKFYRLPTMRCENDTICHAFLTSFTVYRHEKNATVFGVSRPLHIKTRRVFLCRYTVKLERKARRITAAVKRHGVPCFSLKFYCLPTKNRDGFWCVRTLKVSYPMYLIQCFISLTRIRQ